MSAKAPDDQPLLREIFLKALDLPSGAVREAYLEEACTGNAELRGRAEALFKNIQEDTFLERPAVECGSTRAISPVLSEGPGTVIAKYKLLEKLGEGGFGVVYMAEQKQPIKRRVALKIIKVGMDTREVVARFEAERQAVALMDHPNIAKVFDAGATDTGRPYFVMELVRGIKLTDYCDEKNLGTRQRLDLFMQVCQAVQHAHQKGIIHRDLKPSNILVTINDGVPVPKIIDFGIAKATQMELTEKTVFTRFQQFIGTPAYMSPEQAEITSVDVDTRSDIYSLGVLLYELLTGKTPFDGKELLQAGIDEMRRTLREKEPERPSTRVSTLDGEELTTTAKRRGLEAPKLVNVLRGDLDWIVMKCLDKDRARRYETANGLANDIQRHLNSEPVVACPPSRVYRLRKTVRRNKGAFAAAAVILLLLLAGIGISTWQAVRARRAEREQVHLREEAQANEQQAKAEAGKKDEVAHFFTVMLEGVGPSVAMGRDTTILREILDSASARIGAELTNQHDVEQFLRCTIGNVYESIGQLTKAEASLRLAVAAGKKVTNIDYTEQLWAIWSLGWTLMRQDRHEESEAKFREILKTLETLPAYQDRDVMKATTLDMLGTSLRQQGYVLAAEPFVFQALDLRRKLFGTNSEPFANSMNSVALVFREEGKFSEAENSLRETLRIDDSLEINDAKRLNVYYNLAVVLDHGGKLSEAADLYQKCLEIAKKLIADRPETSLGHARNLSIYFYGLRSALTRQGKLEQADACRQEALANLQNLVSSLQQSNGTVNTDTLLIRGDLQARLGKWSGAVGDLRRAQEISENHEYLDFWQNQARALFQAGELDAYHRHNAMSLERISGSKDLSRALGVVMNCLISPSSSSDLATVSRMAQTGCNLERGSSRYSWYQLCKGLAEYRQANLSEAIESVKRLLAETTGKSRTPAYFALPGDPSEQEVAAYAVLAMAQERLRHPAESRDALAKAQEIANAKLGKPGEDDLSYVWSDWIMAQALLQEAKELIEGPGTGSVLPGRAEVSNGFPATTPTRTKSE